MVPLKLRPEFLTKHMRATAIELCNKQNSGWAQRGNPHELLEITFPIQPPILLKVPFMHTAQTVYESSVAALPKSERLKLAAIILDELTASAGAALDFSDSWNDEDLRDVTAYAANYAAKAFGEEPIVPDAGDIVVANFPGGATTGTDRRPAASKYQGNPRLV